MSKTYTDTERLDFLLNTDGALNDNQGAGYIYWFCDKGKPRYRTHIVDNRTAREALDAAMNGETNSLLTISY